MRAPGRRRTAAVAVSTALLAAALSLLAAGPTAAAASPHGPPAGTGVAEAVPSVSPAQHPFMAPIGRPSEAERRPSENRNASRITYTVPEAKASPACRRHFCVHWVAEGVDAPNLADRDGDRVPDYVETVLTVAEEVREIENVRLGWREPKSDGRRGGGLGKTDIYLAQIGGALFGYAAPDRRQGRKGRIPRRLYGYLVLDDDYSPAEFRGDKPLQDLRVTLAHEYNHILQFGYDAYQDPWFAEATATWMEERVYPRLNDYLRYVRRWCKLYDTPLTASSIKAYGSAVWNHWLADRYGPGLVRRAWAEAIHVKPGGFSVGSYDRAIRRAGGSDFSRDFAEFAAHLPEWRSGEGFDEGHRYPNVQRQGRLPLDGRRLRRLLNHTTFQLLRVRPERGRAIVVEVTAPRGTAAGLALVGRIGSERRGRVVRVSDYARNGGRLKVRLADPSRFNRITATIANADASARGFSAGRLDWLYLTDQVPFEVRGQVLR